MEGQEIKDGKKVVHERHLPHDLVTQHILTRLPIKSLIRFKSVSKLWYSTLLSNHFANAHFKLSPFSNPSSPIQCLLIQNKHNCYLFSYEDDDEVDKYTGMDFSKGLFKLDTNCDLAGQSGRIKAQLVGSCNGLVCLVSTCGSYFIVWNPITRQCRKVYDPFRSQLKLKMCLNCWGFGYVSSVDDYKIVVIIESPFTLKTMVHVFSLSSNKWRVIAANLYQHVFCLSSTTGSMTVLESDDSASKCPRAFDTDRGVFANETLYWIVFKNHVQGRNIVAFDLALETFDVFGDLDLNDGGEFRDRRLCVMAGCLSKSGSEMSKGVSIDILRSPGEVKNIRVLSGDLDLHFYKNFIGFTRTGKFFAQHGSSAGIIDPSSQPMNYTPILEISRYDTVDIVGYVPSLISPTAL